MGVGTADRDLGHLLPPFRQRLERVLEEVAAAVGEAWRLVEGYRSPERQLHLYAQGRTRPGRRVTWQRTPRWHGAGLAADCIPARHGYRAPMAWWRQYREIYLEHGLDNPAWEQGDLNHVQLSDPALRAQGLAWARAGFPQTGETVPAPGGLRVLVAGHLVPDAEAGLQEGRLWARVRPLADALGLVILKVARAGERAEVTLASETREYTLPVVIEAGRGLVRVRDLPAKVRWDERARVVTVDPQE